MRSFLNEVNPIQVLFQLTCLKTSVTLIEDVATYLPKEKILIFDYLYINSIQKAKGKA